MLALLELTLFSFQGAGPNPFQGQIETLHIRRMLRFDLGGDKRNRTADPLLARQVLSQLSYTPVVVANSVSLISAFAKTRSLHCSSSSNRTRFAGLRFEFGHYVFEVVGPSGLEPPTSRLSVVRSSQLSYGPVSSSRTSYRSLPPSGQSSLTPSLRLFLANPLRWALLGVLENVFCVRPLN